MGQNLSLNLAEKGHRVVVFNRTSSVTDRFLSEQSSHFDICRAADIADLCRQLPRPRALILMVKAGDAIDKVLSDLVPHLDEGDVVIDGGNSHWRDTSRRVEASTSAGVHYIGAGISGGEEGARNGPSIMPGGAVGGWDVVGESLQSIAAKVDGEPCCAWLGPGGSGHFVKMVHNGIEYADMQLIAEVYDLLRASGRSVGETGAVFRRWQSGPLDSFLIDITATILEAKDSQGQPIVESVLDAAAQKGTGRWTVESAMELGQPTTVIAEAVMARSLSAMKEERVAAAQVLGAAGIPRPDEGRPRVRSVGGQGSELRPGFHDHKSSIDRAELGPHTGRDRAFVAGRMHHPGSAAQRDHQVFCCGARLDQPPPRRPLRPTDEGT